MNQRFGCGLIALAVLAFVACGLPMLIPLPTVGVPAESLADPGGRFVDVNGLNTYVLEAGPQDGQAVLLLHGFGGSTVSWREQINVLADAGFRVVAFDRPPYGLSQKIGDLPRSQAAQADFTAGLMDTLGIESAVLVGHSMGGGVVGQFAARWPERVDALVFVSGAPAVGDTASRPDGGLGPLVGSVLRFPPVERWARIALRLVLKPDMFASMLTSAYFDSSIVTADALEGYTRQLRVEGWDEGLIGLAGGGGGGFEPVSREALAALPMPVAIFWGENDTWVPIAAGEAIAAALPGALLTVYPQTGHLPMEERPAEFNRDLLAFLEGVFQ